MCIKKTKYIGFRISTEEFDHLSAVQENIARASRGQKPEIAEIIRSVLGWGNKELVSAEERAYIAGQGPLTKPEHKKRTT